MAIVDYELEPQRVSFWRSEIFELGAGLIIVTLVTAVLLLLAAIDPSTFTFQSDTTSRLRHEMRNCLGIDNDAGRLDCYDKIAHQPIPHPARGANMPARLLTK